MAWPFTGLEFTVDRDGAGWSYSIWAGLASGPGAALIERAGGFATQQEAIRAALDSPAGL